MNVRASVVLVALLATTATALGQTTVRQRGFALFDKGDYAGAVQLLAQHVAQAPSDHDAGVRLGWAHYRRSSFSAAAASFAAVLARDPSNNDARIGSGYCSLQAGRVVAASHLFLAVIAAEAANTDALRGLVMCSARTTSTEVRAAGLRAVQKLAELGPLDDDLAVSALTLSGEPARRLRKPAAKGSALLVEARAGRDYLETRAADGSWRPIFIKGFNLGAALPGRFPTEFPADQATYRRWLETMADLGSNAVRLYTLLPPAFYAALHAHNTAHPGQPLLLVQGVWTELPPRHDFLERSFVAELQSEIARIIDAVHGNVIVGERPGHASGVYRADVSRWTLAYVIGREWEPFAVHAFNAMYPSLTSFEGRWLRVSQGHAMEAWVARMCDFAAEHEASFYAQLHPLTFANWPTLDPLSHPTESNRDEEDVWRRKLGLVEHGTLNAEVWEDDLVTLDATRIAPTSRMTAGFFASYHIYPNYPDFMYREAAYADARDGEGPSRYSGYLRALKKYHGHQPVLVAEFGMSTSRGVGHVHPTGWHHGGVDERTQGQLVGRMLRAIRDERYAGGVVFSFMDEWFKGTWSAAPWEAPEERRRLWLNVESPEQLYGVVANRPAAAAIRVDGKVDDWSAIAPLMRGASPTSRSWAELDQLRVTSDEAYVYLAITTRGGDTPLDWSRVQYTIAVDTYSADRGEHVLPGGRRIATGAEFLIELVGPAASRILGVNTYGTSRANGRSPMSSPINSRSGFARLTLETNRERFSRDGSRHAAITVERGALRFGSLDPASASYDRRTDVSVGSERGVIEVRIPWALLNVGDPSSRSVLHDEGGSQVKKTDGFRFYVAATKPDGAVVSTLPAGGTVAPLYTWKEWDAPTYHTELKDGAALIRDAMVPLKPIQQ